MASQRDVEADERAPLLASPRTDEATSAQEEVSEPQSEASKRREYGWRGFWIVVAILAIAFFVKGWIDADDVDVSRGFLCQDIHAQCSRRLTCCVV